ncbi:MAG: hypothetical protein Q9M28_04300 [Mariprofundaceae bacterium]|nr:hypothetical protein [Mariprofundaceae bacterium]
MIHYITTYGFEQLGIYKESTVYIPREVIDLPSIQDDLPFITISASETASAPLKMTMQHMPETT